jgi:hypothetical protein
MNSDEFKKEDIDDLARYLSAQYRVARIVEFQGNSIIQITLEGLLKPCIRLIHLTNRISCRMTVDVTKSIKADKLLEQFECQLSVSGSQSMVVYSDVWNLAMTKLFQKMSEVLIIRLDAIEKKVLPSLIMQV